MHFWSTEEPARTRYRLPTSATEYSQVIWFHIREGATLTTAQDRALTSLFSPNSSSPQMRQSSFCASWLGYSFPVTVSGSLPGGAICFFPLSPPTSSPQESSLSNLFDRLLGCRLHMVICGVLVTHEHPHTPLFQVGQRCLSGHGPEELDRAVS